MGIVPYRFFLQKFEATDGRVALPLAAFRHLITLILQSVDFDEQRYLDSNPDVAAAIRRGDLDSARLHYAHFGYFEGRKGDWFDVDEHYYRTVNSDVDQAIKIGQWVSAAQHFDSDGIKEWRSPNEDVAPIVQLWKEICTLPNIDVVGHSHNQTVTAAC